MNDELEERIRLSINAVERKGAFKHLGARSSRIAHAVISVIAPVVDMAERKHVYYRRGIVDTVNTALLNGYITSAQKQQLYADLIADGVYPKLPQLPDRRQD